MIDRARQTWEFNLTDDDGSGETCSILVLRSRSFVNSVTKAVDGVFESEHVCLILNAGTTVILGEFKSFPWERGLMKRRLA